jgi:hypothetical protein
LLRTSLNEAQPRSKSTIQPSYAKRQPLKLKGYEDIDEGNKVMSAQDKTSPAKKTNNCEREKTRVNLL